MIVVLAAAAPGTAHAASANHFIVSVPAGNLTTGAPFTATIIAAKQSNAVDSSYSGTRAITFADPANAPDGTTPSYPATVTFTGGVGTAAVTLFKAESTKLQASDGSIRGETAAAFTVLPGPLHDFTVGAPTPAPKAGQASSSSANAFDAWKNLKTDYNATATLTHTLHGSPVGCCGNQQSSCSVSPGSPGSVSFSAGQATITFTAYKAETGRTLTVTDGSVTATSAAFAVTPSDPAILTFVQQPTQTQFNVAITPAVKVKDEDRYANLVAAGTTVEAAIASGFNPGNGTLAGTAVQATDANGIATFSDLSIGPSVANIGVGYKLAATSPAVSPTAGPTNSAAFIIANTVQPCSTACSGINANVPNNTSVSASASGTVTGNALGIALIVNSAPPAGVCPGFNVAPGSAGSYVNLTIAGQGTPSMTITETLDKGIVQNLADNGGAHYRMCLGAVNLQHPDGAGVTGWTTSSGAAAVPVFDPTFGVVFFWGLLPDCPKRGVLTGPCTVSQNKNLGNLVYSYAVPFPWDPSAWLGP
jgi:hypothetical protein